MSRRATPSESGLSGRSAPLVAPGGGSASKFRGNKAKCVVRPRPSNTLPDHRRNRAAWALRPWSSTPSIWISSRWTTTTWTWTDPLPRRRQLSRSPRRLLPRSRPWQHRRRRSCNRSHSLWLLPRRRGQARGQAVRGYVRCAHCCVVPLHQTQLAACARDTRVSRRSLHARRTHMRATTRRETPI